MSKIKLVTHTDLDGIGCAILAYLAFGRENVDVEYCNYDDVDEKVAAFVEQEELFKSYDRVYITDISISEDVANMIDIVDQPPKRVRLFDHHATALRLNKYGWCQVSVKKAGDGHFLKTSGTELFFNHLYNNNFLCNLSDQGWQNVLCFVCMVRDYDTWRWKELSEEGVVCKWLNDLFHIYGRKDFIYTMLDRIVNSEELDFTDIDMVLLDQKQSDIDLYIEKKDKQLTTMKDPFGYTCGVIFAEQYFSELGNRLCEMHPELDYVAMIDISGGTVSYRCTRDNIDLGGEIAHSFGGGGHKKAAGSTFDEEYVQSRIVNEIFSYKSDELV